MCFQMQFTQVTVSKENAARALEVDVVANWGPCHKLEKMVILQ